jgi:putative transposase
VWGNAGASVTPVGVDVGEETLVAAAPADGTVDDVLMIDGEHLRETFRLLRWQIGTLQELGVDTSVEAAVTAVFWRRLYGQLTDAAARTMQYAERFPGAVLVLEDISYQACPLFEHRDAEQPGQWILPALQERLVDRATDAGIPVAWVDPAGTSTECHRCGKHGERGPYDEGGWHEFHCLNDSCAVDVVDVDASAALTIASRV